MIHTFFSVALAQNEAVETSEAGLEAQFHRSVWNCGIESDEGGNSQAAYRFLLFYMKM